MKKQLMLMSVMCLSLVSCYTVKKDAVFKISGEVRNARGTAQVASNSSGLDLCIEVTSLSQPSSFSDSFTKCQNIVTDQEGKFSFKTNFASIYNQDFRTYEIKNIKTTARVIGSHNVKNLSPVKVNIVEFNQDGGTVNVVIIAEEQDL